MLFSEAIYVGIRPTRNRKPVTLAALDSELRLTATIESNVEECLAYVAGQPAAIVAVAAPQAPAAGLLGDPERREGYDLAPYSKTWSRWRVAAYELRRRNIAMVGIATLQANSPEWLELGFRLYQRLAELGYTYFQRGAGPRSRSMIEVQPQAAFSALLGRQPLARETLEGRMQRQLGLFLGNVDVPNPMQALEKWTRTQLLKGELPLDSLSGPDELDALVAAYTAFRVGRATDEVVQVGDPQEGLITLPASALKDYYPSPGG